MAGVERDEGAEGEPAGGGAKWNPMPLVGDQQEPIERGQVMGEARNIADAEGFAASFAKSGDEHQGGRDPGQTGDAEFRKGSGQQ